MTSHVAKSSTQLPTYDEACRFLAAMVDLEPVKEISRQADGIKAKDPVLLEQAIRIRFEATKNIGRIIREIRKVVDQRQQRLGTQPIRRRMGRGVCMTSRPISMSLYVQILELIPKLTDDERHMLVSDLMQYNIDKAKADQQARLKAHER